ncbi:MAG: PAS domain-containing sensor histidine kinase [Ferrovibrionaceae bacterium]
MIQHAARPTAEGPAIPQPSPMRHWPIVAAVVVAAAIFLADILTPLEGAVAVLYTTVVLLVARTEHRRAVPLAGLACGVLATIAFVDNHGESAFGGAHVRFAVSLTAIMITTLLCLRNRSARWMLAEQARILELTHDTVIIRDSADTIRYWNDGAEVLYGWRRSEAIGRNAQELLSSDFPVDEVVRGLAGEGKWSGEMTRIRRDGRRIVLASRWLQRFDAEGRRIGIIETSADLTEQIRADAERRQSEERYRTIFNAAGFAIWESDWSDAWQQILAGQAPAHAIGRGALRDANDAAVKLFGMADRAALLAHGMAPFFTPHGAQVLAAIVAELASGERLVEKETEFSVADGRIVEVVMRVTLPLGPHDWSRVLVMAADVTERNEAQAKLVRTQAELAHASRVSMLGQLAASIAHEVNQPLAAIVTYGRSGKRWLAREAPGAREVADCLEHVVSNGTRAADVIGRIRSLARSDTPPAEPLAMRDLIEETILLVGRDAHGTVINLEAAEGLPDGFGDKVQIQQVVMNLLINGIQAMADVAAERRVMRVAVTVADDRLQVAVSDRGPGMAEPAKVFNPFFTTKADGMGMGLSICQSIIEAHGGRIAAANNPDDGATFTFTLPIATVELARSA